LKAYLKIYDEWDANKRYGLVEVKLTRIDGIVYWVFAYRQSWFSNSYEEIPKIAGKNLKPIPTLSKTLVRADHQCFLGDLRAPYEEYPL